MCACACLSVWMSVFEREWIIEKSIPLNPIDELINDNGRQSTILRVITIDDKGENAQS